MKDTASAFSQVKAAARAGKLSAGSVENIRTWLTAPYLAEYAPLVAEDIAADKWRELEDAFWTVIPFGTGGRRGRMYPIGCNAINDRTIGESAQGLADYVKEVLSKISPLPLGEGPGVRADLPNNGPHPSPLPKGEGRELSCAVAYDTRHRSRQFAELCAEIMVAAGYTVYFLDGYRSTPELSFAVRQKKCDCGIIITASHNPPEDNAVKVYWSTGGQLLPPHDAASIGRMQQVTWIHRTPFAEALAAGRIVYCQKEIDAAYVAAVVKQSIPGPRDLKIIYSPLHGVGASSILPALQQAGFSDVELFGPHAQADGDFPNIPKHVANPENPAVFTAIIQQARQCGAELILASDPDADRLGCAAPQSLDPDAPWVTLTGNQIGALLADYLLEVKKVAGTLTTGHYVVKTLVTTDLIRRIVDHYRATTYGNLLVGFKYIGGEMDYRGTERFVLGAEESYGFLVGDHVRDKDAAVAAMLLAELAARLKASGKTLCQRLDELFLRFGCHTEGQINVQMPGEKGLEDMNALMARFRSQPPQRLGGLKLLHLRDYLNRVTFTPGNCPDFSEGKMGLSPSPPHRGSERQPLDGPKGDLVFLDLEGGNAVAVRPSGTEPKIKFYLFACDSPEASADLPAVKAAQAERLRAIRADLHTFAGLE
ncbi:MAG: phospho-sugar mutase [Pirellulales bacterium]|nr:phospho-sugar mutase [Pirellulales bacterium]